MGLLLLLVLLLALPAALLAWLGRFRVRFRRDAASLLAQALRPAPPVTEADLAALPPLMQAYLRRVGAVGRPRVRNVHLVFDARMRTGPRAPWMRARAEQYEFFDPPARLFHMEASRAGVPFDVYHRYVGGEATFQVRLAGLFRITDAHGPLLTRAETVTLLNDIVLLAPAAALDLPMTWETSGPRTLRVTFTNAGFTVAAELSFDEAGDLVGFLSNDRYEVRGREIRNVPWSTPVLEYREVSGIRIAARANANYIEPGGEWTYGTFELRAVSYNL